MHVGSTCVVVIGSPGATLSALDRRGHNPNGWVPLALLLYSRSESPRPGRPGPRTRRTPQELPA
ncbi:hypothetical protein ppKF707_3656 [Metapseudomonas furukawaii]|uniref:Uncharacterized protein n=1 Tax=Metapseudomonas furukawaii TaxID=1149133 RepID=A0AAD1BXI9_METFU|nr:hypothetical protein ppKF707_3656 [Pseudomonas furukawaii]BAU73441.1 hypothetical protein KF707C_17530 [Pseudomonas furukawaii]